MHSEVAPPAPTVKLIDSHAHLDGPEFDDDRNVVIHRAQMNGLEAVLSCGTTLSSSQKNVALAAQTPSVYAAIGIHPHETYQIEADTMTKLKALAKEKKVVAVGETGLDYFYNFSLPEVQQKSFALHVRLARELGLPLSIHCRNAEADLIRILKAERANEVGGVIHCFTGSVEASQDYLELGFYLGVSGIITFKTAETLTEVISNLPLSKLLVETDSPYLAPTPHRGKRNEPSFVTQTAKKLAELKSVPIEEVSRITTQNAKTLFSIH